MTLRTAFTQQGRHCAKMGSPFMARLMAVVGERLTRDTAPGQRMLDWPGDVGPTADSVPLRFAGALHALVLQGHDDLAAVYPPNQVDDDALWSAVGHALQTDADDIDRWLDSPPQTNEVRRSVVLIPVGALLANRFGLPLTLSEIGASAGLNLMFDRFSVKTGDVFLGKDDAALTLTPDWQGPVPKGNFTVSDRRGVDLRPIDPTSDQGRLRLMAYLWPDQPYRLDLTRAAIDAFDAQVDAADALDWLPKRLEPRADSCHLIYSTVAWQYLPEDARAQGAAMIQAAGQMATKTAPLAWFTMEGDTQTRGAALTLRLWPGDLTFNLGRADFHGRWVRWAEDGDRLI